MITTMDMHENRSVLYRKKSSLTIGTRIEKVKTICLTKLGVPRKKKDILHPFKSNSINISQITINCAINEPPTIVSRTSD